MCRPELGPVGGVAVHLAVVDPALPQPHSEVSQGNLLGQPALQLRRQLRPPVDCHLLATIGIGLVYLVAELSLKIAVYT